MIVVAALSFLVALTGAMAPGPLLTYTIARTVTSHRRGFLTGLWVIAGHAALEAVMIAVLLLGFSTVLRTPTAVKAIGVAGGGFLVFMGASLLVQLARGTAGDDPNPVDPEIRPRSPVLGGVLVSMSNPYWWIWWASVGFAFMVRYRISASNWPMLVAFFAGHEAGDLAWYLAVSVLVHLGRRRLAGRAYRVVLGICAALIAAFGLYLGVSAFLIA